MKPPIETETEQDLELTLAMEPGASTPDFSRYSKQQLIHIKDQLIQQIRVLEDDKYSYLARIKLTKLIQTVGAELAMKDAHQVFESLDTVFGTSESPF